MSRRVLAVVLAAALAALALLVWLDTPRGPRVVAEGEPIPFDEKVEMRFADAETGDAETWKLDKKVTTRDESIGAPAMPEPDPAAAEHEPDESARALDAIALESWKHGELDDALTGFERAIAADPDDRLPRSHLGRLLTLMTDYEQALPHLERAAALDPEDPQVWLDLHTLYARANRLGPAIEARKRAEALAGGRPIVQDETGIYRFADEPSFP